MANVAQTGRILRGASGLWEVCVGLEVHAQVASKAKLFSASPASVGLSALPNSAVSLFDASHPGSLPSLQEGCVAQAIRAGVALRGTIPRVSSWVRKHYAYADLPHGFQITQLEQPIVHGGFMIFDVPIRHPKTGARTRDVRPCLSLLTRVQLEMDSGKSVHDLVRTQDASVVDFNRAGAPLLELVGAPDLRSADEAGAYVREIAALLRHAGISAARIEEGGMRVDVNVSIRVAQGAGEGHNGGQGSSGDISSRSALWSSLDGQYVPTSHPTHGPAFTWDFRHAGRAQEAFHSVGLQVPGYGEPMPPPPGFGARVELKNLAGSRAVEAAVASEAARQISILERGGTVSSETRTFDAGAGTSAKLRGKEDALDYRFLLEPDVPPLLITSSYFHSLARTVPPSRADERSRLVAQYGLTDADASVLLGVASDADVQVWDTMRGKKEDATSGASTPHPLTMSPVRYFEEAVVAACAEAGVGAGAGASTVAESGSSGSLQEISRSVHGWMMSELVGRLRAIQEVKGATAGVSGRVVVAAVSAGRGGGEGLVEGEEDGFGQQSVPSLLTTCPVSAPRLGALVACVHKRVLSGKSAKRVLGLMLGQVEGQGGEGGTAGTKFNLAEPDPRPPQSIIDSLGLSTSMDSAALLSLAQSIVLDPAHGSMVDKWRGGQERVLGAFVAKVLQASGNKANPAAAAEAVKTLLGPQDKKSAEPHMGRKASLRAKREAEAQAQLEAQRQGSGAKKA